MTRADDLKRFLSPERHVNESWGAYKRRRRTAQEAVDKALRGRMFHMSILPTGNKGVTYERPKA